MRDHDCLRDVMNLISENAEPLRFRLLRSSIIMSNELSKAPTSNIMSDELSKDKWDQTIDEKRIA